ncbi:hypothetical protein [Dyella flagellata]|uniref:Uncharacterized protein n=1 Tax=Dyella flagellata TaxID=1867833 RepID=A0ABQ5X9F5_9GAMM|nr:hypothetical protein [Dyella flagellata]GLQ87289.1 hypothetical protein GCM10007898_08550 [Dyella flagellata]
MFLVVQHPLADLRRFLGAATVRLGRPAWPIAEPRQDYVRSFGQVRARNRGGLAEWPGEDSFCLAHAALRFPNHLRHYTFGSGPLTSIAHKAFRRIHSDGTVSRAEIGFSLARKEANSTASSNADLINLLRECIEFKVFVRGPKLQFETTTLASAGSALARNYLRATTDRKAMDPNACKPWWVSAGNPAVVLESLDQPPLTLTRYARKVMEQANLTVSHDWMQFGAHSCSMWFIEGRSSDEDALRRLRIHLMRLHAERECLRIVLTRINESKLDLAANVGISDEAQQYLHDSIRALEKPERFGLPQSAMLEVAQQALEVVSAGQAASLNKMRRQVAAKVEAYIRRAETSTHITNVMGDYMSYTITLGNVSVQGDFNFVTAKNIENSFNKTAGADIKEDLKERLKELNVATAKLAAQLSPEKAEEVSKDLQTLTAEAISKQPRKPWYELSAKGLVEAAKTVAEMAAPIATAVQAVLALLA